ncbi:MAG: MFS transporter [Alphaproteobacteria bacterium]|nr:MFS transporter [Alphaproteobacteria bacterium]
MSRGDGAQGLTEDRNIVPVHTLGISQICAYGLLFYAFAQLKIPLAEKHAVSSSDILAAISVAMVLQALLAPVIGRWVDRFGALNVMRWGFFLGSAGMLIVGLSEHFFVLCSGLMIVGFGYAMCTYEIAFGAAVQLDEAGSRKHISVITFYGGVASSITWMAIGPLMLAVGLTGTFWVISVILLCCGIVVGSHARGFQPSQGKNEKQSLPFSWRGLTRQEKQALVALASTGCFEYLLFASTTLMWITWFEGQYHDPMLAIYLASIYGPFQVVGRVIEMKFGHRFDARVTAVVASCLIPVALMLVQIPSLAFAILAMMIFGMGHGILTVSFGFITNLYFRAEVYGRAKGIITAPKAIGAALGPSLGGFLYAMGGHVLMLVMVALAVMSAAALVYLLWLRPTNEIHMRSSH